VAEVTGNWFFYVSLFLLAVVMAQGSKIMQQERIIRELDARARRRPRSIR
jgi:hypothetical protein